MCANHNHACIHVKILIFWQGVCLQFQAHMYVAPPFCIFFCSFAHMYLTPIPLYVSGTDSMQ